MLSFVSINNSDETINKHIANFIATDASAQNENKFDLLATLIITPQDFPKDNSNEDLSALQQFFQNSETQSKTTAAILEVLHRECPIEFSFNINYTRAQFLIWLMNRRNFDLNELCLYNVNYHLLTPKQRATFFSFINASNFYVLNLNVWDSFHQLTPEEWREFCANVKSCKITLIKLMANNLNQLSLEGWIEFCRGLSISGIMSLELGDNDLFQLLPEQWIAFFAAVKIAGITTVGINENGFFQLTFEQCEAFFTGLSTSGITSLNLSFNMIGQLGLIEWAGFCSGLSRSGIVSLSLSSNEFFQLTSAQWMVFIAGLSCSGITLLRLGKNSLFLLTPEQWIAFFSAAKASGITVLDLEDNDLYQLSPEQWEAFFTGLSNSGITSLYLRCNGLFILTPEQWKAFFIAATASGITSLDLSQNGLYQLTLNKQWETFFVAAKIADINFLDLSKNAFGLLTEEEKNIFFQAIEVSQICHLTFENSAECSELHKILFVNQLISQTGSALSQKLSDEELFSYYKLPHEIHEDNLNEIIESLYKRTNPLKSYIIGLLLVGFIPQTINEKNDSNIEYFENRYHRAIDFFMQAYLEEPTIRTKIIRTLWHLKKLEYPSIVARLSSLNLNIEDFLSLEEFNALTLTYYKTTYLPDRRLKRLNIDFRIATEVLNKIKTEYPDEKEISMIINQLNIINKWLNSTKELALEKQIFLKRITTEIARYLENLNEKKLQRPIILSHGFNLLCTDSILFAATKKLDSKAEPSNLATKTKFPVNAHGDNYYMKHRFNFLRDLSRSSRQSSMIEKHTKKAQFSFRKGGG